MSTLLADTIRKTGGSLGVDIRVKNTSVYESDGGTSVTQNIVQGLAKQWCHTSGVGTPALADSFYTASVKDNGTGSQGFSFSNNMGNANYSTQALVHLGGDIACIQQTADSGVAQTTALTGARTHTTSAAVDADKSIAVHGDLA